MHTITFEMIPEVPLAGKGDGQTRLSTQLFVETPEQANEAGRLTHALFMAFFEGFKDGSDEWRLLNPDQT